MFLLQVEKTVVYIINLAFSPTHAMYYYPFKMCAKIFLYRSAENNPNSWTNFNVAMDERAKLCSR